MALSTEERFALLEQRVALLEAKLSTTQSKEPASPFEKMFSKVGIAFVLFHASQKIRSDPNFHELDDFVKTVLKMQLTAESRSECADKLFKISMSLLDDAKQVSESG